MGTGGSNPPFSASLTGYSVVRLSRLLWEQEVASSNLAIPTKEQLNCSFFLQTHAKQYKNEQEHPYSIHD